MVSENELRREWKTHSFFVVVGKPAFIYLRRTDRLLPHENITACHYGRV